MHWEMSVRLFHEALCIIGISNSLDIPQGFLRSSVVKNLPAKQETLDTQVRSLGQEDPLEEEMAIHSSILAWKITWIEEPGRP